MWPMIIGQDPLYLQSLLQSLKNYHYVRGDNFLGRSRPGP